MGRGTSIRRQRSNIGAVKSATKFMPLVVSIIRSPCCPCLVNGTPELK